MRVISTLLISMLFGTTAYADDVDVTRDVMDAITAKDYATARTVASTADDPIVTEIADWHALRAGEGTFPEYEKFLTDNAEWPGLPWLQARGEIYIPADAEPQRVIDYINHNGVQTDEGLVALLRSLKSQGKDDDAEAAFRDASQALTINESNFEQIAGLYPELATQLRYAHIDYLLFEGKVDTAAALAESLAGAPKALADARTLMKRDGSGINEALGSVPSQFADNGGLVYDRMRYRYTHGNRDGARELMLSQSTSRVNLLRPEYWAETRADMTRSALRANDGEMAYRLASNHYLKPDERGYLDLEFLSGFAALEFLNDATLARTHFANLKAASQTPISSGRAGYWLGRAGDPSGYEYGAQFQTSFYGQLAAEVGGIAPDQDLTEAIRPDFRGQRFMQDDNIKAALLFKAADQNLLAHRFLAHASERYAQSPAEAEALGQLALTIDLPHAAVNIGKNMANFGHVITHSYYPIPDYITSTIPIPQSAALSIMRQESEFYSGAQSHVGARGLMQLMPATAERTAGREGLDYEIGKLKSDPEFNVQLGSAYLAEMLDKWNGSLPLAAASYNAGPGRAEQWLELNGPVGNTVEEAVRWVEMIPFDETRNYVQRVLEGVVIYDAKLRLGFGYYQPSQLLTQPFPRAE